MTDSNKRFNKNDAFICDECFQLSTLDSADHWGQHLRFPNKDFSLIETKCPECHCTMKITPDKLKRAKDESRESLQTLQKRIIELEKRIGDLVAENKEKDHMIKTKDDQIGELLKANGKLADGVDRLTRKLIEGDLNNPNQKSNDSQMQPVK